MLLNSNDGGLSPYYTPAIIGELPDVGEPPGYDFTGMHLSALRFHHIGFNELRILHTFIS